MTTLTIRGTRIDLVRPTLADWEHVRGIWEDEATMADVGGTHSLPEESYRKWHDLMFASRKDANEYFLIFNKGGTTCLGEVSFHNFDKAAKRAIFNIKVKRPFRSGGVGREAMDLILQRFFEAWGGEVMEDSLWEGNPNGLAVLLKYGFRETGRRDEEGIWIEMTRDAWIAKRAKGTNLGETAG